MTILAHPLFVDFGIPLITVILSFFLRYVTRNDQHISFQKEDFAFGIDLTITAVLVFLISSSLIIQQSILPSAPAQIIEKTNAIPWILFSIIVGLWAVSTLVRKKGWEGEGKLHIFWGIIVPDVFGIMVLLFVVTWVKP